VAAAGPRAGLELAAVDRDALAHPDQAVPSFVAVAVAAPVVAHRQLDVPVAVADEHLRPARPRMLERVRQALLNEAVRGQVDARRQLLRLALDPELDRQAGLARMLDEAREVAEARLWRERGRLLRPA